MKISGLGAVEVQLIPSSPVDATDREPAKASETRARRRPVWLALGAAVLMLALLTLFEQERILGLEYIETTQLARHTAVVGGTAPMPWQYRVLSELLVAPVLSLAQAAHLPRPIAVGFLAFRLAQNLLLFSLVAWYLRRLTFSVPATALGLAMLAWCVLHSFNNGDLSLNAYSEACFYVLAALAIHARKELWIIPITFFAALNRETSGLIPAMLVAHAILVRDEPGRDMRRTLFIAAGALAAFAFVFFSVRAYFGPPPNTWSDWPNPAPPGPRMLWWNVSQPDNWRFILATMSLLPVLALAYFRLLPRMLQAFFIAIVPVYFAVHFGAVFINETRYFIMPMAVVFIPATLWILGHHTFLDPRSTELQLVGSRPVKLWGRR